MQPAAGFRSVGKGIGACLLVNKVSKIRSRFFSCHNFLQPDIDTIYGSYIRLEIIFQILEDFYDLVKKKQVPICKMFLQKRFQTQSVYVEPLISQIIDTALLTSKV
jgi:hypothetical protein